MALRTVSTLVCLLMLASLAALAQDTPWPAPVAGWTAPAPGEHPRLFFRKADVPALRAKAQTPEGKFIVERLKATLGGGEAMPTVYNPLKKAYEGTVSLPEGAYTISHAAGFGMLYQLTGDVKYADLAKQCFIKGLEGVRDRDGAARYALLAGGGQLRSGPVLGWYALAYDLCYDAWDEPFRQRVVKFIQTGDTGLPNAPKDPKAENDTLDEMVLKTRHHPASNHWGSIVGGCGLAVLAIKGDPGTDAAKLEQYDRILQEKTIRALTEGFGDHGYFAEGPGPSHVGSNAALVPYLQALNVAAGKDYITPRPNGQWLTLRWVMEVTRDRDGRPVYPCRGESSYGTRYLMQSNGSMTHGGWFSQGFGAIPEAYQPALLWTYNTFCKEYDSARLDTAIYPHRAIMALVNWPIGTEPKNPSTVLPHAVVDETFGYYAFRNRWQDENDVIVTLLQGRGPESYAKPDPANYQVMVQGLGERITVAWPWVKTPPTYYKAEADGSGVVTIGRNSLGIDFTRRSGADAVIVRLEASGFKDSETPRVLEQQARTAAGRLFILTLCADGMHPKVKPAKVDGQDVAIVGGLCIGVRDGNITFADAPGVEPGRGADLLDALKERKIVLDPPLTPADIVEPTDAVLHLTFDAGTLYEKDGKLYARNTVGDGGDMQLINPRHVAGVIGNGAQFPKGSGGIIAPYQPMHLAGASHSYSFWYYNDPALQGNEWLFTGPGIGVGHHGPAICDAGLDCPTDNQEGMWYHIVIVRDLAQKRIIFYVNGERVLREPFGGGGFNAGTYYLAGGDVKFTYGAPNAQDELALYPHALTRGEVLALYRKGQAAIEKPGNANRPPLAKIVVDREKTLPGTAVAFDATTSMDFDGDALSYAWDFGDGATAEGPAAKHTYEAYGAYRVTLTATDARGGRNVAERTMRVENRPPEVRIEVDPITRDGRGNPIPPADPTLHTVDAGASFDPDGLPITVAWKTSDGQQAEGTKAAFRFATPGHYDVVATLTDAHGLQSTVRRVIDVDQPDGARLAETPARTTPGLHYRLYHWERGISEGRSFSPPDISQFELVREGTDDDLNANVVMDREGFAAVLWSGFLKVPADGTYTFSFYAPRYCYLWIGNTHVFSYKSGFTGRKWETCTAKLQKGLHRVRVLYATKDPSGAGPQMYNLMAKWEGPGMPQRWVESSDFCRSLTVGEQRAAGEKTPLPGADVCDLVVSASAPLGVTLVTGGAPKENRAPTAAIKADVPASDGHTRVTLKATAADADGDVLACTWQFGDGMGGTGAEVAHGYAPGVYTATLTVDDGKGGTATAFTTVTIGQKPLRAIGIDLGGRVGWTYRPHENELCGVKTQRYWNRAEGKDLFTRAMMDNTGAPTTAKITVMQTHPYSVMEMPVPGTTPDDYLMISGHPLAAFTMTGIPYATYDVYLYNAGARPDHKSGPAGSQCTLTVTANGQAKTMVHTVGAAEWQGAYLEEDGTDAGKAGNYLVFRGLTGADLAIAVKATQTRWQFGAVQIVEAE